MSGAKGWTSEQRECSIAAVLPSQASARSPLSSAKQHLTSERFQPLKPDEWLNRRCFGLGKVTVVEPGAWSLCNSTVTKALES